MGAGAEALERWNAEGQTKIALVVRSLSELNSFRTQCEALRIVHAQITDAGSTELVAGTVTAVAIGPAEPKAVDKITASMPLLK